MSSTDSRKRSEIYEETPNSKRQELEKPDPIWSDLSHDIIERVIGRLRWIDRIRIQAVCKGWSIPYRHIPTIDRVPWAMKFSWASFHRNHVLGECLLFDPLSREYVIEKSVLRGEEYRDFVNAIPRASMYGWVLFSTQTRYFMYSPFTTEMINLPDLKEPEHIYFHVAKFSLSATSPKCVVFLCRKDIYNHKKVYIKLCSVGDTSWKNFEFNNDHDVPCNPPIDGVYANGNFYCVFGLGQLGAFNVEREEWTVQAGQPIMPIIYQYLSNLIAFDGDLWLLHQFKSRPWKLYKFDFSEKSWVYESTLNNHVLFIASTSFLAPTVGEISQLANTIFSCYTYRSTIHYGSISPRTRSETLLYRKCADATKWLNVWIEVPSGGLWRANDLINAV